MNEQIWIQQRRITFIVMYAARCVDLVSPNILQGWSINLNGENLILSPHHLRVGSVWLLRHRHSPQKGRKSYWFMSFLISQRFYVTKINIPRCQSGGPFWLKLLVLLLQAIWTIIFNLLYKYNRERERAHVTCH